MNDRPSDNDTPVRPLHVVMICIVSMTVAGVMLLLSAARPTAPVDGAIEWHEQSLLRALVELLCLNYQMPTFYADAIKNLILGIGAGLAVLALTIAIISGSRSSDEDRAAETEPTVPASPSERHHIAPLMAAQVLFGLYLLWSFASSRWSSAPDVAVGASIFIGIPLLWAFALGHGLSSRAARIASRYIAWISGATAVTAIWYHYGRNPTLRADFPAGNPTFLAACLIPGILVSIGAVVAGVKGMVGGDRRGRPWGIIASVAVVAVCGWATYLADSRGPAVGLLFGLLAMVLFALRGWKKLVPIALGLGIAFGGYLYYQQNVDTNTPTNRGATMRLRTYAWDYAWRMFSEHPLRGHGQGAFTLTGDTYASDDVLSDPLVFQTRIAHAHNEWLEVMADLGAIGIVLIAAALLLTLKAGAAALKSTSDREKRWVLIGLMSALVGLVVEECFGVGLRVSGVSTMFFATLGLIWAVSATAATHPTSHLSRTRTGRTLSGLVGGFLGIGAIAVSQQDFSAARYAYRAQDAIQAEDFAAATEFARRGVDRLNPQRVITNLFRLTELQLHTARFFQLRGRDRELRAQQGESPDARLTALAMNDYRLSDEACEQASGSLKELVKRAPGFFNHGRLAYWLNLTRAGNASSRDDLSKQQALVADALVAIERELRRQPYNPSIALDYARLAMSQADPALVIDVLARPLRHNRIEGSYVQMVRQLLADAEMARRFDEVMRRAKLAATTAWIAGSTDAEQDTWAPEKLRLGAMARMSQGDFQGALALLEPAAERYAALSTAAPRGAASFHAELADCRFFCDPTNPAEAIANARHSIALAPNSRFGRELEATVRKRMVHYLLALGDEDGALELLRSAAPAGVDRAGVMRELGTRYYLLARSLMGEPITSRVLSDHPSELLTPMDTWVRRGIVLNPDDPSAHYIGAAVAFHADRQDDVATHLRNAIKLGLRGEVALEFLNAALIAGPLSPSMSSLRASLIAKRRSPVAPAP